LHPVYHPSTHVVFYLNQLLFLLEGPSFLRAVRALFRRDPPVLLMTLSPLQLVSSTKSSAPASRFCSPSWSRPSPLPRPVEFRALSSPVIDFLPFSLFGYFVFWRILVSRETPSPPLLCALSLSLFAVNVWSFLLAPLDQDFILRVPSFAFQLAVKTECVPFF